MLPYYFKQRKTGDTTMKKDSNTSYFTFSTTSKYDNSKSCDCVIRSISLAMGLSWQEVFDDLCAIARELYRIPTEAVVYKKYLKSKGWVMMPCPKKDGKKVTAKEFAEATKGRTIIAHVGTGHMSCFIDGKIHDIWNCGKFCVGNYWVKEETD